MLVDEVSYQISKLLRKIKIGLNRTDRAQIVRIAGVLLITLAVLGTSPVEEVKEEPEVQGIEAGGSKVEAGDEDRNSKLDNSSTQSPASSPAPSFQPQASVPTVSAQAAYVIDNETATVLFEKNSDWRLPMASLTKIMTAAVVLDEFPLDEKVVVPELCTYLPPLKVGYVAGQELTVEELLYGMLVSSASDASCALSHHFDGNFLELMNRKAVELGLTQTHFENEIGLDGKNGNHLSTAKDLVRLSKEALKSGVFRKIVGTAEWHGLTSTNELLFTLPGTTGIKTGYTDEAKGCLAVSYERDGHEIIGVLLSSDDRFLETQEILNWIFKAYHWE